MLRRFPPFLVMLFFVEMWERFSYYGMRTLLVLFLTSSLGYTDTKAYAIYSLFGAVCYATPMLGGLLADKLAGFRNMVLLGSIIMIIGHFLLSLVILKPKLLYLGIALVAVGSGMFKGNITNILGSCYKKNDQERSRGFTLFYVSINLGSCLASIVCGYIADLYGWYYGFGAAGCGMVLGLATFIKFQHVLGNNGTPPNPELMNKRVLGVGMFSMLIIVSLLLAAMVIGILAYSEFFANEHILIFFGIALLSLFSYIIIASPSVQKRKLLVLSILTIFFMWFFALEMQLGSLINLFTKRNVVNEILGYHIPSALSQAINPFSIILFGTLFGVYMRSNKRYATSIFAFGILTMTICFFILYIGCLNATTDGRVSYLYLISAIASMGLGELCVAPLVQEQATLLAPKHLRGLIMGIIMSSVAFSNLFGILISKYMSIPSIDGNIDSLVSLEIYKRGFFKIAMLNLGLTVLFLPFYSFVNKIITHEKSFKI